MAEVEQQHCFVWKNLALENVLNEIKKGNENAKTVLAWLLLSGRGGAEKNECEAVRLLEERSMNADAEAMWMLGICKEYSLGTEHDTEGAKALFHNSSDGGNPIGRILSQKSLGKGDGTIDIWCLLLSPLALLAHLVKFL